MTKQLLSKYLRYTFIKTLSVTAILTCWSFLSFAQTGKSLNFAETDDYALTATDVIGGGSYTKEVWVRFPSLTAATAYNILSQNNDASALFVYNNRLMAGQNPAFPQQVADPDPLSPNVWYHVAVTYDLATQTITLYKNGVSVATGAALPIAATGAPLAIGATNAGSYSYGMLGDMDEVRVWDYARTAGEILSSYTCTVPPQSPGLVLYYDFNQGDANDDNSTITVLTDRTPNMNDATLYDFALNGTTSNFTDAAPPALTGECSVVPVKLSLFEGQVKGGSVNLHWRTATEINNAGFDIERSANGSTGWQSVGFVAGKGNSVQLNDYHFADNNPAAGVNYYRLNQKDLDGNSTYSKVISVTTSNVASLKLYPTMAVSKIHLSVGDKGLLHTPFVIFDNSGKRVASGVIKSADETIDISNLNKGIYFLKVQNGSTLKFLKQ